MLNWKSKRRVLLAVTGGISAYKTPEIVRDLVKNNCEVEIILTPEAESFVTPLVLSTLISGKVWRQSDFLSPDEGWKIPHIDLADWAEVILVAPATAQCISCAARGEAGSLLGATLLAARCPVLFFPAMNVNMWEHKATQRNTCILTELGYRVIEPESGDLACGYTAKGRLPSKEVILHEIWRVLCPDKDLLGKKVLVTAGPTWEFLDPVRFLSNPSSGKMGFSMARAAWYRGADVIVVSGPVEFDDSYGFKMVSVVSARDMLDAVLQNLPESDFIVKAAAVGDYRSSVVSEQKMKRSGKGDLILELTQNPDIASQVGVNKQDGQVLIGFAAESEDLVNNARDKLLRKRLDFIVVNDITATDAGFQSDTNSVQVIGHSGIIESISGPKSDVAYDIWNIVTGKEA